MPFHLIGASMWSRIEIITNFSTCTRTRQLIYQPWNAIFQTGDSKSWLPATNSSVDGHLTGFQNILCQGFSPLVRYYKSSAVSNNWCIINLAPKGVLYDQKAWAVYFLHQYNNCFHDKFEYKPLKLAQHKGISTFSPSNSDKTAVEAPNFCLSSRNARLTNSLFPILKVVLVSTGFVQGLSQESNDADNSIPQC